MCWTAYKNSSEIKAPFSCCHVCCLHAFKPLHFGIYPVYIRTRTLQCEIYKLETSISQLSGHVKAIWRDCGRVSSLDSVWLSSALVFCSKHSSLGRPSLSCNYNQSSNDSRVPEVRYPRRIVISVLSEWEKAKWHWLKLLWHWKYLDTLSRCH